MIACIDTGQRPSLELLLANLAILLILTACGPTSTRSLEDKQGASLLPPAEVLQLVEGNTLFIHAFEEDSYLYFDPQGLLFGRDIYDNKDHGRWDVSEDGELCLRMTNWWYGDLLCYQVLRNGSVYHLAGSDGVLKYSAEQLPGDAKGLYVALKKKKKKSYRRSLRRRQEETVRNRPTTPTAPAPAKGKTETETPGPQVIDQALAADPVIARRDLRSTVKWMARDCPGCNLAESDLKKADLVAANLPGANLRGALLKMANLRRANLEGADLEGADLSYANLPGANLRGANLRGASLKGANLIRADLSGADLAGADLTDALTEGAVGLKR